MKKVLTDAEFSDMFQRHIDDMLLPDRSQANLLQALKDRNDLIQDRFRIMRKLEKLQSHLEQASRMLNEAINEDPVG